MRLPTTILPLFCLFLATTARGHEPKEGDVWATAGPFGHWARSAHPEASRTPWLGGAIVAEGDVDYNGGVEIALMYLDKTYVRERADDAVVERIKRMYVTTGYRHWFIPALSAGLAIASSYSMGDPKVVLDERPSGEPLETTAREVTEYGIDLSWQWEFWSSGALGLVADARYAFSLSREQGEDADHYGLLVAFKYLVPKRGPK